MTVVATPTPTPQPVRSRRRSQSLLDPAILVPALGDSFRKLSPRWQALNPVMFIVGIGAVMTTYAFVTGLINGGTDNGFVGQIALWLWFTVLFANFAEAVAEGRGKAQAATLRRTRSDTIARKLVDGREVPTPAPELRKGDIVVCEAGDVIPSDGVIREGIAACSPTASSSRSPRTPGRPSSTRSSASSSRHRGRRRPMRSL